MPDRTGSRALRAVLRFLDFGVFEDVAFVVADDDAFVVVMEDVAGVDRDLSTSARSVDNELRNGVTRGVAAQAFDNFEAFRDGGAQVRGAVDEVALVNVIRPDAAHEEFVHKRFHDGQRVVDAFEEDALVAERDAVVGHHFETGLHFGGELARVVGVDADPERVIFLQHLAKLRRDALWQEDRDAAADAKKLDVLDLAQAAKDGFEFVVGEKQGVAAGKEDVANLGVFLQILKHLLEIGVELLFADATNDPGAGAIAAIRRATIRDQKQYTVRVTMNEPRHGHVAVFTAGIGHIVG